MIAMARVTTVSVISAEAAAPGALNHKDAGTRIMLLKNAESTMIRLYCDFRQPPSHKGLS